MKTGSLLFEKVHPALKRQAQRATPVNGLPTLIFRGRELSSFDGPGASAPGRGCFWQQYLHCVTLSGAQWRRFQFAGFGGLRIHQATFLVPNLRTTHPSPAVAKLGVAGA